jgi:hypothetical protein
MYAIFILVYMVQSRESHPSHSTEHAMASRRAQQLQDKRMEPWAFYQLPTRNGSSSLPLRKCPFQFVGGSMPTARIAKCIIPRPPRPVLPLSSRKNQLLTAGLEVTAWRRLRRPACSSSSSDPPADMFRGSQTILSGLHQSLLE